MKEFKPGDNVVCTDVGSNRALVEGARYIVHKAPKRYYKSRHIITLLDKDNRKCFYYNTRFSLINPIPDNHFDDELFNL